MSKYRDIKKLDEVSRKNLREPDSKRGADECICEVLAPLAIQDSDGKGGVRKSIRRAFASFSGNKKKDDSRKTVMMCSSSKNWKNVPMKDLKDVTCTKCADDKKIALRQKTLNVEIVMPDVSNVCSCKKKCLQEKLKNNVEVCIERLQVDQNFLKQMRTTDCLQRENKISSINNTQGEMNQTTNIPKEGSWNVDKKLGSRNQTFLIQRIQMDTVPKLSQKESDIHQFDSGGSKTSETVSKKESKGSKLISGSLKSKLSKKSSDIHKPNSCGSKTAEAVSKKDSQSKIGSKSSKTGSLLSKLSKISRKRVIHDPDDIDSEFSVLIDTKIPDSSKLQTQELINTKIKGQNNGFSVFNEYAETKSAHSVLSKTMKD